MGKKVFLGILLATTLLVAPAYALDLQYNIIDNPQPGGSVTIAYTVSNNVTTECIVSIATNLQIIQYDPSFTFNGKTSRVILLKIPESFSGTALATVTLSCKYVSNNSPIVDTKTINYQKEIVPYILLLRTNVEYPIKIRIVKNGEVLYEGTFDSPKNVTNSRYKIVCKGKLVEIYGPYGSTVSIEKVEKKQTQNTQASTISGDLMFLYRQNVIVQQGVANYPITIRIVNQYKVPIQILFFSVEGNYVFNDGTEEPLLLDKVTTGILQPGAVADVSLLVSAKRLQPGTYPVSVTVAYKVGDSILTRKIPITIRVLKGEVSPPQITVNVEIPEKVKQNEEFTVKVKPKDAELKFDQTCFKVLEKEEKDDYMVYKIKGTCIGKFTWKVIYNNEVLKKGEIEVEAAQQQTQLLPPPQVSVSNRNPCLGDTITITTDPEATIYVNNREVGKGTATIPVDTNILRIVVKEQGLKPAILTIVAKNCYKISAPDFVEDPNDVVVKVLKNGQKVNCDIDIPSIEGPGVYRIKISCPGYTTTKTVVVGLSRYLPSKVKTGETIQFPRNITVRVLYNNKTIYEGTTDKLSFSKPGVYYVEFYGKKYKIEVESNASISKMVIYAIILLIVGYLIYRGIKGLIKKLFKKGEKEVSFQFASPSGEVEMPLPPATEVHEYKEEGEEGEKQQE